MLEYTEEQLKQIEDYASIYLRISDMATLLGLNAEMLRADISCHGSPAYIAYQRGKAMTTVRLRAQETQLAMVGSPLALENARLNLLDMEDDE